MPSVTQSTLVPAGQPFVEQDRSLAKVAIDFLIVLLNRTGGKSGDMGYGNGLVSNGLVATGNNQATALALIASWNEVDTVAAGTGVQLQQVNPGQEQRVFNQGASSLAVYPPLGVGMKIDALSVDASFPLASGKMQIFQTVTIGQIRSMKLG